MDTDTYEVEYLYEGDSYHLVAEVSFCDGEIDVVEMTDLGKRINPTNVDYHSNYSAAVVNVGLALIREQAQRNESSADVYTNTFYNYMG